MLFCFCFILWLCSSCTFRMFFLSSFFCYCQKSLNTISRHCPTSKKIFRTSTQTCPSHAKRFGKISSLNFFCCEEPFPSPFGKTKKASMPFLHSQLVETEKLFKKHDVHLTKKSSDDHDFCACPQIVSSLRMMLRVDRW